MKYTPGHIILGEGRGARNGGSGVRAALNGYVQEMVLPGRGLSYQTLEALSSTAPNACVLLRFNRGRLSAISQEAHGGGVCPLFYSNIGFAMVTFWFGYKSGFSGPYFYDNFYRLGSRRSWCMIVFRKSSRKESGRSREVGLWEVGVTAGPRQTPSWVVCKPLPRISVRGGAAAGPGPTKNHPSSRD